MTSRWRARAAPIIARVLRETAGQPERAIRQALRDAWPEGWGPREHHPYKVWLDEIQRQRGTGRHRAVSDQHEQLQARIREIEAHNRAAEGGDG